VESEHNCEVWSAGLDRLRPRHLALLDDDERARAERFTHPEDRDRSVLAAALLRLVSARLVGAGAGRSAPRAAARGLEIRRTCVVCGAPHGKPEVGHGLHVSVSHAGALVVVVATRLASVGVDIEPMTRSDQARAAARTACAGQEREQITGGCDALRYWTRKEAIVKASGEGLTVPLADVVVSAPHEPARLLKWAGRPTQECTLVDLDLPDGYLGALAVLSAGPLNVLAHCADELLAA